MKKLLLLITIFSSWCFAAERFILKLNEKNYSQKDFSQLQNDLGEHDVVKKLNLSFGTYWVVTTNKKSADKLKAFKSDMIEYIEPSQVLKGLSEDNPFSTPYTPEQFDLIWKRGKISDVVSDPMADQQWGLNNRKENTYRRNGIVGFDMNIVNAWKLTKGDRRIKVAIIDSGIKYDHPDLVENIWVNEAEKNGQPGIDDDGNGYVDDIYGYDFSNHDSDPMDDHGHGTHCAGIIGAKHNDIGIAGIADQVQLMGVKFLDSALNGSIESAIEAIDYAIKMEADIINNSWGGVLESQALADAFVAIHEAGIIATAASGNAGANNNKINMVPANYPTTIAVGNYRAHSWMSYTSNYGYLTVDTVAPGDEIISTSITKSGYEKLSGTSEAAPHVTGMLVLLLALNPEMTPQEAKLRVVQTSVFNPEWENYIISGGRADAYTLLMNIPQHRPTKEE